MNDPKDPKKCPICKLRILSAEGWSCEYCAEKMSIKEYNQYLCDHQETILNNLN